MADSNVSGPTRQGSHFALDHRLLRLAPEDNVAVATTTIPAGEALEIDGEPRPCDRTIPTGHKVAIARIPAGAKVLKYGAPIGSATCDIQPGCYVHTHNLKSDYLPTYTYDNLPPR